MKQTLLLSFCCIHCFVFIQSVSGTVTPEPIRCSLNRRAESCPKGQCCARDEFLPTYIICKDIGITNSSCSTVPDDSVCPCEEGLICVPNVDSQLFVSIHGTCKQDISTTSTSFLPTTIPTTRTTTLQTTTAKHNHPPLIRLQRGVTKVSKKSGVGYTITKFTVTDKDQGKDGEVKCSVLQPPLFQIKKEDNNTFQVVVASSMSRLRPQSVLTFIICEDNGKPKLNGIAQLTIQIVEEDNRSTSSSTISTATSSTSTLHSINTAASSISTLDTQSPELNTQNETVSISHSSSKRPLSSVTFN